MRGDTARSPPGRPGQWLRTCAHSHVDTRSKPEVHIDAGQFGGVLLDR